MKTTAYVIQLPRAQYVKVRDAVSDYFVAVFGRASRRMIRNALDGRIVDLIDYDTPESANLSDTIYRILEEV